MSKLKVAKAIHKGFTIAGVTLKWLGIAFIVVGISTGLWAWAIAHFLSFAIVIGIVLAIAVLSGIIMAWDWSKDTIREAAEEERIAQQRARVEKERLENPGKYIPDFDSTDPYGTYR